MTKGLLCNVSLTVNVMVKFVPDLAIVGFTVKLEITGGVVSGTVIDTETFLLPPSLVKLIVPVYVPGLSDPLFTDAVTNCNAPGPKLPPDEDKLSHDIPSLALQLSVSSPVFCTANWQLVPLSPKLYDPGLTESTGGFGTLMLTERFA